MSSSRRMTAQRRLILTELAALRIHPTADELYELVRLHLPRISLGTVYRNLQVLAEEGLVRVLAAPEGGKRYDADLSEHNHLRCLGCGRVTDLESRSSGAAHCHPPAPPGFRLLGYRLEYVGLCPECAARQADDRATPGLTAGYHPLERRSSARNTHPDT